MYVSAVVKDEALSDFEAARKEWDSAFAQVPDEALTYLKPGDDYAVGGLQVHVNWVLVHYRRVLDGLVDREFAQLPPLDPPGENDEFNQRAKAGLTPEGRRQVLADAASVHLAVLEAATELPASDWSRKAPVVYGAGQDPYPTSAEDVIGWLADHYREHVQQCPELVADWRKTL
jgi:DinB superfamily